MKYLFTTLLLFACIVSGAFAIVPYEAIYKAKFVKASEASGLSDITGLLKLTITDACDGWAVEQSANTNFYSERGASIEFQTSQASWENYKGTKFRFHSNLQDNDVVERIAGTANLNKKTPGMVVFDSHGGQKFKLSPRTQPPLFHMLNVIKQAKQGKVSDSSLVFNGDAMKAPVLINSFVAPSHKLCKAASNNKATTGMHFAIYRDANQEEESSLPDLELTQWVTDDGVICQISINTGDYKMIWELEDIKFLNENRCEAK
jgi:hypothetical protein